MSYESLKALHMLGIVLFLGNIVVTGWWKGAADRTRDARVIAFAQRQVTLTDWLFTAGGAALLYVPALLMLHQLGLGEWSERWIVWGHGLFLASGVIWVAVLIPLQVVQARMARRFADTGAIPARYWTLTHLWLGFGVAATVLPLL
ncbi:MAG TPA: DUF2269 family protein, partial [Arenicellales bacterium]|nr:DUF2269 family protein [Arenicellales bacterium]